jgi:hypothetical protein
MDRQWRDRFNEEVERYRKSLIYYAKSCEWETFDNKAGILFDYLEMIEQRALERRFFSTFFIILAILAAAAVAILITDDRAFPVLLKYRNDIVLSAIAVSNFELYFYLDFRMYVKARMSRYKKRREQFIKNIERDFKEVIIPSLEKETSRFTSIPQQLENETKRGQSATI